MSGVSNTSEYHDMAPSMHLPDAIRDAIAEYGYRERALGICKTMSVGYESPETFMSKDLSRRDRAASRASELIAAAIGLDGEVCEPKARSVSLPIEVDRAIASALRAHVNGKGKPGTRSAMRAAIANAIADAVESQTYALRQEIDALRIEVADGEEE